MHRLIGPGPGNYKLPSLTGKQNHDFTKKCEPAYTFGIINDLNTKKRSPGPKYNLTGLTVHGKASPPEYSIKSRLKPLRNIGMPGPADYKTEDVPIMNGFRRPPRYTMMPKTAGLQNRYKSPGPMAYGLPSTIGPKVPDKNANAAYTIKLKHNFKQRSKSPGPAAYSSVNQDICKEKSPVYSMRNKVYLPTSKKYGPGPKYKPKEDVKNGYSFGLKTFAIPFITLKDQVCMPKTGKMQVDIC